MALLRRLPDERVLTASGVVAWALAVGFVVRGHDAGAAAFVTAGVSLFALRAFYPRVRKAKVGPDGVETELTAPVSVSGSPAPPPRAETPNLDPSVLVARWPTLHDAFDDVPQSWTQERIRHEDGQTYLHVRSPEAGFDLVVNVAVLDSPAPRWLMAAIAVMAAD